MSGSEKRLLLVDLVSWVYAHGVKHDNAAILVVQKIKRLRERFKFDRVIACGESPTGVTFRNDLVPNYKAKARPDNIKHQIATAIDLLRMDGMEYAHALGFEGDDVIASLAAKHQGQVIIASADSGCRQLLESGRVSILPKVYQDEPKWFTAADLMKPIAEGGTGLRPDQWVDYLALVGDAANGIIGAAGIGSKTAPILLAEYGTFEGLLEAANAGKLRESWAASLRDMSNRIDVVRQLVRFRRDAIKLGHAWQCVVEDAPEVGRSLVCRCPVHRNGDLAIYGALPGDENDRVVTWVKRIIAQRGWFDPLRDVA